MRASAVTRRHQEIQKWRQSYQREGRVHEFVEGMGEIFSEHQNLKDFRLRPLFEALVDDGHELVQNHFGPTDGGGFQLSEAADTVSTALFATIQGQFLYNAILKAYKMPELIGDSLVTSASSIEVSERIPGITAIGDQVEVVNEGEPYQRVLATERFVDTPDTIKRGLRCDVTKEAIFFDKTNLILQEASNIGKYIGINRERRILDVVLGIATVYKRNGNAAVATYTSENTSSGNPLTDFNSLDTAHTKYAAITDPDTGEPIVSSPNAIVVPPALKLRATQIRNAMETIFTGTNRETRVDGASLHSEFAVASNQYVKERTGSDSTWFYGNPGEAFVYMENWPLTVESEGATGPEAFNRDIVACYKASERGAAGVVEKLYNMKCTA
jgi:hypothetical protein